MRKIKIYCLIAPLIIYKNTTTATDTSKITRHCGSSKTLALHLVRWHREKHLILLLLSHWLRCECGWLPIEVMKGSLVVCIFKVDGTVHCTPGLILLLRGCSRFHRGTLPTRERVVLGPRRILLLLLVCWGDTSRVTGQCPRHRLELRRWPLLESVLVVIVRLLRVVPELFLVKLWCPRLLRGTAQSVAFDLELLLILCLL